MICEDNSYTIQVVSNALQKLVDQPFGDSYYDLVTCVRSRTHPKIFEKQNFLKSQLFDL